jgi:uncharacterized membrane protein (DUF2068 family)
MDCPDSIWNATAMQCLVGLGYLGLGTFFVVPMRATNEMEAFAVAGVHNVPAGVGWIAIGLLALFGTYGMWRGRLWGWLLGLLADLGATFGWAYYIFKDFSYLNWAQVTFGIALATIPAGWLLSPDVRNFYWRS